MRAIAFDTLSYANRLQSAGFTRQQAEVLSETQAELIDNNLATKRDIEEMRLALKRDIAELEQKMLIKVGAMIAASIAITTTLVKAL